LTTAKTLGETTDSVITASVCHEDSDNSDVDSNIITWQAICGVHINKFDFTGNNSGVRDFIYEDYINKILSYL
jgi:hypothetical protein